MKKQVLFLFVLVSLISSVATAEVINVPKDYSTIQEAVDTAVDGDKIVVGGSYVGAGALIQDKSLILVGGGALIIDGPFRIDPWVGEVYSGFIVRGAASSGTSISHFTFQDLEYPVLVIPNENEEGLATVDDITISHNRVLGTAAFQAITLRGTKRGMVCYNRIDYARDIAIFGTGGWGNISEDFTVKHNVIDFSQQTRRGNTGITSNKTRGAIITHNRINMSRTRDGQAVYIRFPVGDDSQIVSFNDFRGSDWDFWQTGFLAQWPGPFTLLYPVLYEKNFSDAGAFPNSNRGGGKKK